MKDTRTPINRGQSTATNATQILLRLPANGKARRQSSGQVSQASKTLISSHQQSKLILLLLSKHAGLFELFCRCSVQTTTGACCGATAHPHLYKQPQASDQFVFCSPASTPASEDVETKTLKQEAPQLKHSKETRQRPTETTTAIQP